MTLEPSPPELDPVDVPAPPVALRTGPGARAALVRAGGLAVQARQAAAAHQLADLRVHPAHDAVHRRHQLGVAQRLARLLQRGPSAGHGGQVGGQVGGLGPLLVDAVLGQRDVELGFAGAQRVACRGDLLLRAGDPVAELVAGVAQPALGVAQGGAVGLDVADVGAHVGPGGVQVGLGGLLVALGRGQLVLQHRDLGGAAHVVGRAVLVLQRVLQILAYTVAPAGARLAYCCACAPTSKRSWARRSIEARRSARSPLIWARATARRSATTLVVPTRRASARSRCALRTATRDWSARRRFSVSSATVRPRRVPAQRGIGGGQVGAGGVHLRARGTVLDAGQHLTATHACALANVERGQPPAGLEAQGDLLRGFDVAVGGHGGDDGGPLDLHGGRRLGPIGRPGDGEDDEQQPGADHAQQHVEHACAPQRGHGGLTGAAVERMPPRIETGPRVPDRAAAVLG